MGRSPAPSNGSDSCYTVLEAADRLGFTKRAVIYWLSKGKLAGYQIGGENGRWRVFRASVDSIVSRPIANLDIGNAARVMAAIRELAERDSDAYWFWEGGFETHCASVPRIDAESYRDRLVRDGVIPTREQWHRAVAEDRIEPVLVEPRRDIPREQDQAHVTYGAWKSMGCRPESICGWRIKGWPHRDADERNEEGAE